MSDSYFDTSPTGAIDLAISSYPKLAAMADAAYARGLAHGRREGDERVQQAEADRADAKKDREAMRAAMRDLDDRVRKWCADRDAVIRAAVANLRACAEVLRKARRGAEFAREAERAAAELEGMLR